MKQSSSPKKERSIKQSPKKEGVKREREGPSSAASVKEENVQRKEEGSSNIRGAKREEDVEYPDDENDEEQDGAKRPSKIQRRKASIHVASPLTSKVHFSALVIIRVLELHSLSSFSIFFRWFHIFSKGSVLP